MNVRKGIYVAASISALCGIVSQAAASAVAEMSILSPPGTISGFLTIKQLNSSNQVTDSALFNAGGGTSTTRVLSAQLNVGSVGATIVGLNLNGQTIANCTVTDPAPVAAGPVQSVCQGIPATYRMTVD